MTDDARSLIPEYVLGLLPEREATELLVKIEASPELQRELSAVREALSAGVELAPVQPRKEARERLLAAAAGPERRFAFLPDLMRYFDLGADRVRELLRKIDDATSWEAGPMPGIFVMHFDGGPNAFASDVGFVRFPAGLQFPHHKHLGDEVNYVLQGVVRDGDGKLYYPGDALIKSVKDTHSFSILEGQDALLAVAQDGYEFIAPPG